MTIDVDNQLKDIYELDEVARIKNNGIYVVPSNEFNKIRIRDLVRYCKENNRKAVNYLKAK